MKRRFRVWSLDCLYRRPVAVLTVSWLFSSVVGIFAALSMSEDIVAVMRCAVLQPMSISGMIVVAFLPFLLSALAVFFSELWLLPVLGGFKAFGFGYCSCGILLAFGQSSWLIRGLLLFTDCFAAPILYFFSLRHISSDVPQVRKDLLGCLSIIIAVSYIDYKLISPFLTALFS